MAAAHNFCTPFFLVVSFQCEQDYQRECCSEPEQICDIIHLRANFHSPFPGHFRQFSVEAVPRSTTRLLVFPAEREQGLGGGGGGGRYGTMSSSDLSLSVDRYLRQGKNGGTGSFKETGKSILKYFKGEKDCSAH